MLARVGRADAQRTRNATSARAPRGLAPHLLSRHAASESLAHRAPAVLRHDAAQRLA